MGVEPNHKTARKPGPLYITQYSVKGTVDVDFCRYRVCTIVHIVVRGSNCTVESISFLSSLLSFAKLHLKMQEKGKKEHFAIIFLANTCQGRG